MNINFTTIRDAIKNEYDNVGNPRIDKCCEYSEEPEKLRELLKSITITYRFCALRKYWPDDKDFRLVIEVTVKRNEKIIQFEIGLSIADTEILTGTCVGSTAAAKRTDCYTGILYTILTIMRREGDCPPDFEDFCAEFGYDTDSIKALTTYEGLQQMTRKVRKIFTIEELEYLPQ